MNWTMFCTTACLFGHPWKIWASKFINPLLDSDAFHIFRYKIPLRFWFCLCSFMIYDVIIVPSCGNFQFWIAWFTMLMEKKIENAFSWYYCHERFLEWISSVCNMYAAYKRALLMIGTHRYTHIALTCMRFTSFPMRMEHLGITVRLNMIARKQLGTWQATFREAKRIRISHH